MLRCTALASCVFTAAACGKVNTFTDAGTADASQIDALAEVDARNEGTVTVTTHPRCCTGSDTDLVPDIPVFVVQPDGTLGDSGVTDQNGEIVLENVQQGAAVTAVYDVGGTQTDYRITTVVGVKPGDSLVFGDRFDAQPSGTQTTWTVQWTPANAYPISNAYYGPCGGTINYTFGTPFSSSTFPQWDSCQTTTADLIYVVGNYYYDPTGYKLLRGAAFADNQTTNFGATDSVPGTFSFDFTGLPPGITEMNINVHSYLGDVALPDVGVYQQVTSDSVSGTTKVIPIDGVMAQARFYRGGNLGTHTWFDRGPADLSAFSGSPPDIPWISGTYVSGATHTAGWMQVGTNPYDAAVARFHWERDLPALVEGGEGGDIEFDWTVLLPPGVNAYAWDDVPTELEPWVPGDFDDVRTFVQLYDVESIDGYDAVRALPESTFANPIDGAYSGAITGRGVIAEGASGGNEPGVAASIEMAQDAINDF